MFRQVMTLANRTACVWASCIRPAKSRAVLSALASGFHSCRMLGVADDLELPGLARQSNLPARLLRQPMRERLAPGHVAKLSGLVNHVSSLSMLSCKRGCARRAGGDGRVRPRGRSGGPQAQKESPCQAAMRSKNSGRVGIATPSERQVLRIPGEVYQLGSIGCQHFAAIDPAFILRPSSFSFALQVAAATHGPAQVLGVVERHELDFLVPGELADRAVLRWNGLGSAATPISTLKAGQQTAVRDHRRLAMPGLANVGKRRRGPVHRVAPRFAAGNAKIGILRRGVASAGYRTSMSFQASSWKTPALISMKRGSTRTSKPRAWASCWAPSSPLERAGVDGLDRFGGQRLGDELALPSSQVRQFAVGLALDPAGGIENRFAVSDAVQDHRGSRFGGWGRWPGWLRSGTRSAGRIMITIAPTASRSPAGLRLAGGAGAAIQGARHAPQLLRSIAGQKREKIRRQTWTRPVYWQPMRNFPPSSVLRQCTTCA